MISLHPIVQHRATHRATHLAPRFSGPPEPSMTWNEEQGWLGSAALRQRIQAEMRGFLRQEDRPLW